MFWWKWRAKLTYWFARQLFNQRWAVENPKIWEWMQGQFARMAAFEDVAARAFYGHLLLHKGQGMGARNEGIRLLGLAARAGDTLSAYQLGVIALEDSLQQPANPQQAAEWLELALQGGHPLAAVKLQQLYGPDGPEATRDAEKLERVEQQPALDSFQAP